MNSSLLPSVEEAGMPKSDKANLASAVPSEGLQTALPEFPATFLVHWPTGPVPACVRHARGLINLGRVLGSHIVATAAPDGSRCENCVNEAKATGAQS